MKRFLTIALVASMGLFVAGIAEAAVQTYTTNAVAGGIVGSRHNLGAFGKHVVTAGTTEICIFCHTPHHSNTLAAPLWNRQSGSEADFNDYDSNGAAGAGDTISGNTAGAGPASLACLSCHDGATQFDVLVNAPGKGGVTTGGSGTDQGWKFMMGTATYGSGTAWNATLGMMGGQARLNIDDYGTSNAYNTGAGLTNDHPIGITYYGEDEANRAASLRPSTVDISSIDLSAGLTASSGGTAGAITSAWNNLSTNRWAISGFIDGGAGGATIDMLLRNDKVECSSCHDPHFSNHSWDEYDGALDNEDEEWSVEDESDGLFLRRVGGNTGSAVCRTCHNK